MAVRRSDSEPISQIAMAIMSAAKATGSAWKLPPESTSSLPPRSREDQGLSDTPFDSISQRLGGLAEQVEDRPHHLRLTPEAVRVLHASVARQVRGADRRTGHEPPDRFGRLDLAAVAAKAVDAGVERRIRALAPPRSTRPRRPRQSEDRFSVSNRPASA